MIEDVKNEDEFHVKCQELLDYIQFIFEDKKDFVFAMKACIALKDLRESIQRLAAVDASKCELAYDSWTDEQKDAWVYFAYF